MKILLFRLMKFISLFLAIVVCFVPDLTWEGEKTFIRQRKENDIRLNRTLRLFYAHLTVAAYLVLAVQYCIMKIAARSLYRPLHYYLIPRLFTSVRMVKGKFLVASPC